MKNIITIQNKVRGREKLNSGNTVMRGRTGCYSGPFAFRHFEQAKEFISSKGMDAHWGVFELDVEWDLKIIRACELNNRLFVRCDSNLVREL